MIAAVAVSAERAGHIHSGCVIRCMLLRREETHTAAEVHCIDDALCIETEEARHKLSHPPAVVAVRLAAYNGKHAPEHLN